MKVLLVNGSPREKGCTYTALCEAAKTLNEEGVETEFFWLGREPVPGCTNCGVCAKQGRCVLDDKVNEFTALAEEYDGFVFGAGPLVPGVLHAAGDAERFPRLSAVCILHVSSCADDALP